MAKAAKNRTSGIPIDNAVAIKLLAENFSLAESDFENNSPVPIPKEAIDDFDCIFRSSTQAYREALIGCCLARLINRTINIRHPYAKQSNNAYNGRTLDERVVNPFLQERFIPCSKAPFLSALRRNIKFIPETLGQRDRVAYDSLLNLISILEKMDNNDEIQSLLRYLLFRFVKLRAETRVPIVKINRLSLEQHGSIINALLKVKKIGGLTPVLLAVAMFRTLNKYFNLNWEVSWQGINVADRATGTGGDVTISSKNKIVLVAEVTERVIDRARVVSIFNTKISPLGLEDYLFLFTSSTPLAEAVEAAGQYFAQGHDINFLSVEKWIYNCLGTMGHSAREMFMLEFLELLSSQGIPVSLKMAWNDLARREAG